MREGGCFFDLKPMTEAKENPEDDLGGLSDG